MSWCEFENVAFLLSQPNTNCSIRNTAQLNMLVQRLRSTTSHRFATWVMCGLQPDVQESYFAVDLVWTTRTFLTPCHYTRDVTQPAGRKRYGSNFTLSCCSVVYTSMWLRHSYKHWMGRNRSVWSLLNHSLQSTEALRHIFMFSHCCINYGWNTDGVLLIYARPTLPLTLLAISKNHWHFSAWTGEGFSVFL